MDMQDKEFDDVFRAKLEGFEAEPSERVWTGIDGEINSDRRRKILMPILSIAASVIVLVTAGLLFIPRHVKVDHPQAPGNVIVSVTPPAPKIIATEPVKQPEGIKQAGPVKQVVQQPDINRMARVNIKKEKGAPVTIVQSKPAEMASIQEPVKEQDALAVVTGSDIKDPVVPDRSTELAGKSLTVENIENVKLQTVTTHVVVAEQPAKKVKRHGIHNFGDLVNLVVAKVDKRKDKAIEFTDNGDDGMRLSAVNIGPVKIKNEEKIDR